VKRALYLNDSMYIVSNSAITTFREGTWDKIGEFTFNTTPVEQTVGSEMKSDVQVEPR